MSKTHVSIPRETVKTLALQIGIRPAARQLGLDEHMVLKWSQRDPDGPWSIEKASRPQSVLTPSQVTRDSLTFHSKESKIVLAKALTKGAKHTENMNGAEILDKSRNVRDLVGAASQLHGWEERGNSQSTVNFNVVADHLSVPIQINQDTPQSNEDDREHASEP